MFLTVLTVVLVFASGLLWWKLTRALHDNAALQAEVAKLRDRARRLRA